MSNFRDKMLREIKSDDPYKIIQNDISYKYGKCTVKNYNKKTINFCMRHKPRDVSHNNKTNGGKQIFTYQ